MGSSLAEGGAPSRAVEAVQASALFGVLGALIWPVPALARTGDWNGWGYLALVGAASSSLFAVGVAFRPLSPGDAPLPRSARALTLASAIAVTPFFAFASRLLRATHHRPLGAVTFAVCAFVLLAVLTLLMLRALSIAEQTSGAVARALVPLLKLAGSVSVLVGVVVLGRYVNHDATQGVWLDAGIGVVLGAIAARAHAEQGWLLRSALPVCCVLWLASLWLVRADAHVRATVKSVPVIAGTVGLLVR